MPPSSTSNIVSSVNFASPAIYAGEEIECIITFRNVAKPFSNSRNGKAAGGEESHGRGAAGQDGLRSGTTTHTHSRMPSAALSRISSRGGIPGHKQSPSLNVIVSGTSSQAANHSRTSSAVVMGPPPLPSASGRPGQHPGGQSHGRSLSIISMNSEGRLPIPSKSTSLLPSPTKQRPGESHTRSASLQYTPSQKQASAGLPPPRNPSPLYEATSPPILAENSQAMPLRPGRRRPGTVSAGSTPIVPTRSSMGGRQPSNGGEEGMDSFKFPADSSNPTSMPDNEARSKPVRTPSTMHSGQNRSYSPSWPGGVPPSPMNPLTRVMSATSQEGTPRTSSEFYSMSNHSDETLFSEITTLPNNNQLPQGRLRPKNATSHARQISRSPSTRNASSSEPETLMMAYVQTMGHFVLDGSLVNTGPFEEVKRKGVQSGGGVVGVERSKRSSGLFGALSWGNIGESLGGLLGGDEMSSMAQMKAAVGTKTIPLLSTPQSLLFIDLRLAPGESKSFSYRFMLPRGLPPTHKGRAMKVAYHLSLGVQRPEGQQVKTLEIPFRMLGSYDSRGDTLGHDLMSPYVLLQDAARTQALSPAACTPNGQPTKDAQRKMKDATKKTLQSPQQGLEDFLRYTERLLSTPTDIHGALLSPTSPSSPNTFPPLSRQTSTSDAQPTTIREAIDLAILRSNFATISSPASSPSQAPAPAAAANRFNISRNTRPVAVLTLLRPAYRLGESVLGTLDFTPPDPSSSRPQPCYSVLLTLESSETIDPSLALRSPASILRATRKVHATQRVSTLFARRVAFNLAVPPDAAPGFETSGVGVGWRVRVEFVVGRDGDGDQGLGIDDDSEEVVGREEEDEYDEGLWETMGRDERGVVKIARERLGAEEFGIEVPIRVLGAVGVEVGNGEGGGGLVG